MVEWQLKTKTGTTPLVQTPDNISGIALLGRIIAYSSRPFVVINERELSVLRRGLTKVGWKRSLYLQPADMHTEPYVGAGLLSVANRWLESDIQIPERGGRFHVFFCDCGTRLKTPEDNKVGGPYMCPECSKLYSGEEYDAAVRYIQHNQLASAALSLALVYGIEKDKVYADRVAEIILKYIDAYPELTNDLETGGVFETTVCDSAWVILMAQAYDLIYYSRSLSDEQRNLIEQSLFIPIVERLMSAGIEAASGAWQLAAVGIIGLTIKNATYVQYALDSFKAQMGKYLGNDGLWPESIHTYHFYTLAAYVHFAEACYRAGIDIYNWETESGKSLKMMFMAPLQYMYPSFQIPAINDGWYNSYTPLGLYEVAYRRLSDPTFAWVLKKGYKLGDVSAASSQTDDKTKRLSRTSFFAFLFGRDLPGRSSVPIFKSQDFPRIGLCTMRNDDDLMVTFDYGPFYGHGHFDKLGFTLYANDEILIPDCGTPGHGAKIADWYRSTIAHNTVVVDGRSQQPAKEYGLNARYSGMHLQFVEGIARDCYPGVVHTRKILLIGNACVVSDMLSSSDEHDYDWFVRCSGEPEIAGNYKTCGAAGCNYPLVNVQQAYKAKDEFKVNWKCENGNLALTMWNCANDMSFALGSCPSETAMKSMSLLKCSQRGQDVQYVSVLAPTCVGESVDVAKFGHVIKIAGQDKIDHIHLKRNSKVNSADILQSDGDIAVVRTSNGEVLAIALVNGSWIRWNDEILLECSSTVDCVEVSFEDRSPVIRYQSDTTGTIKLKTNARAMRINGHRVAATGSNGQATLRITSQMLNISSLMSYI